MAECFLFNLKEKSWVPVCVWKKWQSLLFVDYLRNKNGTKNWFWLFDFPVTVSSDHDSEGKRVQDMLSTIDKPQVGMHTSSHTVISIFSSCLQEKQKQNWCVYCITVILWTLQTTWWISFDSAHPGHMRAAFVHSHHSFPTLPLSAENTVNSVTVFLFPQGECDWMSLSHTDIVCQGRNAHPHLKQFGQQAVQLDNISEVTSCADKDVEHRAKIQ